MSFWQTLGIYWQASSIIMLLVINFYNYTDDDRKELESIPYYTKVISIFVIAIFGGIVLPWVFARLLINNNEGEKQ